MKGSLMIRSLLLATAASFALAGCQVTQAAPSERAEGLEFSTEVSRYEKSYKTIHGKQMAYVDVGEGDPIVFLHGNPTSSYLWRNVMPHLEGKGRLIAPDLIGMGDSEKLDNSGPDRYTFVEHRKYLFGLLDELGVNENVTLVIHDWGSGLGFHWAHENQDAVKGIAFMEAVVAPVPSWDAIPDGTRQTFEALRSPAGEQMALENNVFIEAILPSSIIRDLTETEMAEYRRPFLEPGESRRPTLTWPRQIPIAGEPADVTEIVSNYSGWMKQNDLPKLFIRAEPGALVRGPILDFIRSWSNVTEVNVPGLHFIQEDSPDEIGKAVADWLPE
ncbi:MAG: haloalkane dehalogenase [Pseudomonadota bacterium]